MALHLVQDDKGPARVGTLRRVGSGSSATYLDPAEVVAVLSADGLSAAVVLRGSPIMLGIKGVTVQGVLDALFPRAGAGGGEVVA